MIVIFDLFLFAELYEWSYCLPMLNNTLRRVRTAGRLSALGFACCLSAAVLNAQNVTEKVAEEMSEKSDKEMMKKVDWINLFNGKDLTGWKNIYDHGEAKVVDGEIQLTGDKKFFLITENKYTDFELQLEVMLPEIGPANSGVMFRAQVDKTKPKHKVWGYQAECDPTPRAYSGRIYDEGRRKWALLTDEQKELAENVQAPLGKWMTYRIVCKGDHIRVWVNGQLTSDLKDSTDTEGVIGVQHHGEKGKTYSFRNIKLRELK